MKELKLATVLVRGSTDTAEWSLAAPLQSFGLGRSYWTMRSAGRIPPWHP